MTVTYRIIVNGRVMRESDQPPDSPALHDTCERYNARLARVTLKTHYPGFSERREIHYEFRTRGGHP